LKKETDFNKLVSNFLERNDIKEEKEEVYLKYFPRKLWVFLHQESWKSFEEIQAIIENCIEKDYCYYSEKKIKEIFHQFHKGLKKEFIKRLIAIEKNVYFIPVCNKETYKANSSLDMLSLYLKANNMQNSQYKQMNSIVDLEVKRERALNNFKDYLHYKDDEYYLREKKLEKEKWENNLKNIKCVVFLDDYTGSGSTIKDFINIVADYLPKNIEIKIFCIHGTSEAKDVIESALNSNNIKGSVIFHRQSEPYFQMNPQTKEIVHNFEKKIVRPNRYKDILGFKATQSVVTTYRNTPNNTLSLFWNDNPSNPVWKALFPRRDKDNKIPNGFSCWVKNKEELEYFLSCRDSIHDDDEKIEIIKILIYLSNNAEKSKLSNAIELTQIICYYEDIMQECLAKELVKENSNNFEVTKAGKNMLEKHGLLEIKWTKIHQFFVEALKLDNTQNF